MSVLGNIYAGGRITASLVQGVAPLVAYKSATQSVTSSTTLVSDTALYLPVLPNAIYLFELVLGYTGGAYASSDLKFQFGAPTGLTMGYNLEGSTTTSGQPFVGAWRTASGTTLGGGAGASMSALLKGSVAVAATAGNLQLQWAQGTSNATATTLLAGCTMSLWQIQ